MQVTGSSGSTYVDYVTAASSTAANAYSSSIVPQITLAAKNTGVITTTASSLQIAGPPIVGTNQTVTNLYALNILSGNANINGIVIANGTSTPYWQWGGGTATSTITSSNGYSPTAANMPLSSAPGQATTSTLTGNSIFTIPANGNYRMDVQYVIINGSTAGVMGCWVQLTGPASNAYSTNNRLGRIDWYQTGNNFANTISFNANGLQAGWTLQPAIFNFTSGNVTVGVTDMRIVRC